MVSAEKHAGGAGGANTCIAFIANNLALPGLYAAVFSCVRQIKTDGVAVPIYVFHDSISPADLTALTRKVEMENPSQGLHFLKADVREYSQLLPLHGDWMTYFKFSLPDLLRQYRHIIYLDSDMVVVGSLRHLPQIKLGNAPLAASAVTGIMHSLEAAFFKRLGYEATDCRFNAGFLILNADVWRRDGLKGKCCEFGLKHRSDCRSCDETILVGMFAREFLKLAPDLNVPFLPWEAQAPGATILHFVGSPKPWDIGGRMVHRGYGIWSDYAKLGGHREFAFLFSHGFSMLGRLLKIKRSVVRAFLRRLRGLTSS